MSKNRILILHDERPKQKPPEENQEIYNLHVEEDVRDALTRLGYPFETFAIDHSIKNLIDKIESTKPDLVMMLAECFGGNNAMEPHIIAILEMLRVPYTGSNMFAISINCNKGIQKKILSYHGIKTPDFVTFPLGSRISIPESLAFPLIVKPLEEDSSIGIHDCSVVKNLDALTERVKFLYTNREQGAVVETFIDGREFYVGILGNKNVQVLPIVELDLSGIPDGKPKIASFRVKWNVDYREKMNIQSVFPNNLTPEETRKIHDTCIKTYKVLGIQNYGRIDVRMSAHDGQIYVLEANPNPWIAEGEDLANAAEKAGMNFDTFILKIIDYGLAKKKKTVNK
ncbi:MAG: hypothetical protein P9M13_01900 [Candidatus Ancaeobacter aquaticus]|nr:hypothetical protein [Candidatus Ancaeobacter aquaticus]